jgi:hypothetical protein
MSPPRGFPLLGPGLLTLLAWAGLTWISHQSLTVPLPLFFGGIGLAWLGFGWAYLQIRDETSWITILGWALLFRVVAWNAVPIYEDDHFRYLWDGFRFWQDGTPYGMEPAQWFGDASLPDQWQIILDQINYPSLPTIYGPVCQFLFAVSAGLAPASLLGWKIVLGATEWIGWAALLFCFRSNLSQTESKATEPVTARFLLLLSWCPLLIFEGTMQAHVDLAGFAAILSAWAFRHRGYPVALGLCLALAVGVKLFALLFVPFLLWRQPIRSWITFTLSLLLLYGFFWFRGGHNEWASLQIMSRSWEFNSWLFPLLHWIFDENARTMALVLTLAGGLFFGICFIRNRLSLPAAIQVSWALFLILSPVINPWYLIWFLPWAALLPTAPIWTAMVVVALSYITGMALGDPTQGLFTHPWPIRILQPTLITVALLAMILFRHRR